MYVCTLQDLATLCCLMKVLGVGSGCIRGLYVSHQLGEMAEVVLTRIFSVYSVY